MAQAHTAEIGLLLYSGCQMAAVHGMTDLLETAGAFSRARDGAGIRVSHWGVGLDGKIVRVYDTHPHEAGGPDMAVVPGRLSGPPDREEAKPYKDWLIEQHQRGAAIASSCGGAFVLAETGLLDRRAATTHWQFADAFRIRFPDVRLEPDKIVVDEGDIITAGGLMAWTDLGLRLIGRVLGPTVATETARFFLVDPSGREQRHYGNFSPRLTHGDEAILKLQHWLQAKGGREVTVSDMAREAGLEERTFLRRFKTATGLKPTEYAQHLRMEKARELLQFTKRPVEQISWTVGYEDPAAFRRIFNRLVGLSPKNYRQRFALEQLAA
jgi:transcriptional regulator GlxA family with amidase domain